ncbi:MAG: hypothetical protein ACMG6E_09570 [Candidatus Roizmanbacteria bacterium]
MMNKTALAVSEAIKRYSLPIEEINLMNNGLKAKECIVLINSLNRHYNKLARLNISKNKLGLEGARHLAEAIKQMKVLTHLDMGFNEVGD